MGCTACTEPQCLYKGGLYLYLDGRVFGRPRCGWFWWKCEIAVDLKNVGCVPLAWHNGLSEHGGEGSASVKGAEFILEYWQWVSSVRVPPAVECLGVWDMETACCANGSDCPLALYLSGKPLSAAQIAWSGASPSTPLQQAWWRRPTAAVVAGTSDSKRRKNSSILTKHVNCQV
jgi:hypothetical protein